MKKAVLNKKFLLFALGAFLVSLFFIVPHFAGAQTSIITDAAVGIFVTAFKVFAYIFNTILGFLFMLAGGLVNIAMGLNAQILDKTNTLVSIGWTIARDVANLGFVLIMIVMAVATIVRYEKYSVQKLLPLLIGAAILVNFSLTIAGVFISFSDTISNAFSTRLVAGGATGRNFTDAIAGAFNPQRLLIKDTGNPAPPDPASQGNFLSDVSAAALISISGLVFNVVFLAIAVLSMAALALMLLYRYIYLSILLILSPLAWMFWVFPDLEYLYKDWWKNFIKWCFFLPAVTFFLYLAVETAIQLKDSPIFINATGFTGALTSIMAQGAQMIVLAGLLLGGLIVAQKLGIEGASGAMKLATKAKDGTLKYMGNKGQQLATTPLRTSWGKAATEGMQRTPGLRTIGRGLAKIRMTQEKKAADAAKKLPKDLREQALLAGSADAPEKVAIMNSVSGEWNKKKGEFKKKDDKTTEASKTYENAKRAYERENDKGDLADNAKLTELESKMNSAETNLNNANTDRNKANNDLGEIEKVLKLLPRNIREGLEKSKDEKGEMKMKNVKTGPGYIGRRYGYRPESVMPGKSEADTVLEAALKAKKDLDDASSGGGDAEKKPAETEKTGDDKK